MTNQKTGAKKVRWDLGVVYSGLDDPQMDADIEALVAKSKDFYTTHRGRLSETLAKALADYSEIAMLENKVALYLHLKQSTNVADAAVKAKIADTDRILSQAEGEYLTFFRIELVGLEDDALEKLYASDAIVEKHRPWIEYVRIFKPHILSEPVESALTKRSPFGPGAWDEFFDELEADLRFEFRGEKKTLTEMLHLLTASKDASERSDAMLTINAGLGGTFAKYSAQNLYMVAGSNAVEAKERSYDNPMTHRNKSNRVPDMVVDALHEAVERAAGPLSQRYYRLKAAHLGLKTLKWSDRNAPMPFSDTAVIPFDEATMIVLDAYESFSPTLANLIRESVAAKRIDAPAVKGKMSGAFNHSAVLPGQTPMSFTFLNYIGSNRDVMTLAHELGHGVHGLLAGKEQGVLMSHAPIAYCETASVFGELTTFNFLKRRLSEEGDIKSQLALLMGKIDDVMNTAIRQIGFSNFERRIHGMDSSYGHWHEPKKLSVEELNATWLETLKLFYGEDGEVFTYENAEHLWVYIGHFHRPFYVYGYAFGELLTQSIYAKRSDFGDRFESLYLDLLKSGMTKNVVELLKPFDLDPTDENFWIDGISVGLGAMIKEAEQLSQSMGVSSVSVSGRG